MMKPQTWKRHSNPWSGWTRFLIIFVLAPALWQKAWVLIVSLIVYTIINPILFSPPSHNKAWMSRAVLGEQLYLKSKKNQNKLKITGTIGGIVFLVFIYSAYSQLLWPTIVLLVGIVGYKMWFLQQMVELYDKSLH